MPGGVGERPVCVTPPSGRRRDAVTRMPELLKVRLSEPVSVSDLGRMQDNIGTLVNPIANNPMLAGNQIVGVELSAAAVNVSHGLGRAWTNYVITAKDANEDVWYSSTENRDRFLTLTATGTVTVNVLVW